MAGRLKFRYRNQDFRFRNSTSNPEDPEALLRFEALRTFLRCQPEIEAEKWSIPDFELLFAAASYSFKTHEPGGNLNFPSQRLRLRNGSRIRWSKANIPRSRYFSEVCCFLRRRDRILEQALSPADAQQLWGQPCDVERCAMQYRGRTWPLIVNANRMDFFTATIAALQHTVCFRDEIWSLDEFHQLWHSVQTACASARDRIEHCGRYGDVRWRRTVPLHSLISAAELLHFLHTRSPSSSDEFLHCFDACLHRPASEWDFWCQTTAMRQAALAQACATTSMEPRFYPSDSTLSDDNRRVHLAHCGANWPSAIPLSDLFSQLTSYRKQFEAVLQPPQVCAFCACGVWANTHHLLDLRQLPYSLAQLHSILSAKHWLERQQTEQQNLPDSFQPLSMEDLKDQVPHAPVEINDASVA